MTSVTVARTLEEVEELRPVWERLQGPKLTSQIDFFATVVRHSPDVARPHVVLVESGARPPALVVGRLETARLGTGLGGGLGLHSRVRTITVAYGGFLGEIDELGPGTVLDALWGSLEAERADLVRVRLLTLGTPLHDAALERAPALRRQRFSARGVRWRAELPPSLEEFLAARSKERRKNVRRHARRVETAYASDAEVRLFAKRDELDRLLEDSRRIHRTSYQHALGVGFSDDELYRRLLELSMDRGWFLGAVLYLRGEPAAFQHGYKFGGTYSMSATAFDPRFAELRPGTYLQTRLIERLCADPDVDRIDWGIGDADYKRAFGDTCTVEEDVGVFAARPRPLLINAAQASVGGVAAAVRGLLSHTGRLDAVRRRRRSRLAAQGGA